MAEINSLGYVGLGVSDLDQWQWFATEILGLQVGQRDAQGMSLRMDEHQQRIFLEENSIDDLLVAGWELKTERALEEYVAELRDKGVEVTAVPPQTLQRRKVEKAYACQDPNGFTHEFFFGPHVARLQDPFRSTVLKSRFVCGELGVGHILPFAKAGKGEQTVSFYKDVLKLRVSDYIREEVMPGVLVDATFFHSASGRHHSIATAENPMATKTLNHLMLQVEDLDDVGLAYDRTVKAGIPVALELGHHPNDRMFSFYARTPSGFNFEMGWGGVVIDDADWEVRSYSQLSDWGHKRNVIA
ncbi:2,3-dihydroxybiphenyl 1,2-dioxygenase [Geopseudomonas sagittaria]|uniref:2,3-dihydroxybiphenyl 1,2-dioxygenase n=1 Tax=Geopseudomonas sagittaria TaxID=1135990 RepID=A0A1I5R4A1_9GAMM|nr:VOC family protein [Pseudomonas sagittaria]SFP53339.1 2,3-dihydroxybiphenyl 1,2-dioxygenase [Pseudomonas sagittaria]